MRVTVGRRIPNIKARNEVDEVSFSEENTFSISEWGAHTPPDVLAKNLAGIGRRSPDCRSMSCSFFRQSFRSLSPVTGRQLEGSRYSRVCNIFRPGEMEPTRKTANGEFRIVDSTNFPESTSIAAGIVTLKPRGMRELHWHPTAPEWQFYMAGSGRMTVIAPGGRARTMDFHSNDVGFVPTRRDTMSRTRARPTSYF